MPDLTIRLDVYVHQNDEKLDTIIALLKGINTKEDTMSQELDALKASVEAAKTVEASAITLIQGIGAKLTDLAAQLAAAGQDNAAVAALAADLQSSTDALAAAVTANTPAAPPATP